MVLSNAIKNTDKQRARDIKLSLMPVGYSTPSALVLTFCKSASVAMVVSFSSSRIEGVGVGDLEPCLSAFSSNVPETLFSVSEAESSMVGFSKEDMTKRRTELGVKKKKTTPTKVKNAKSRQQYGQED